MKYWLQNKIFENKKRYEYTRRNINGKNKSIDRK